jgi:hypothetical protein
VPKSSPYWLTILLLAAMMTVPPVGPDVSLMMVPARPAACHGHEGAVPFPQPVSYRCCQSGHNSAILRSSSASELDAIYLVAPLERADVFAPNSKLQIVRQVAHSSADPPDLTPLRI